MVLTVHFTTAAMNRRELSTVAPSPNSRLFKAPQLQAIVMRPQPTVLRLNKDRRQTWPPPIHTSAGLQLPYLTAMPLH